MDSLDPLSTFFIDHPDYNLQDEKAEVERLFIRQQALQNLLEGRQSLDYCANLLAEQGIDPGDWMAITLSNLEWVESNGLILPRD